MRRSVGPLVQRGLATVALVATAGTLAVAAPAVAQAPPDPAPPAPGAVSEDVMAQIAAITADKAGRTPTERKVSSDLLYAEAEAEDGVAVDGVPDLRTAADVDADGRTEVDIRAGVDDALLDRIEALGGEVVDSVPGYDSVRARVPVEAVTELAAGRGVRSVAPADVAVPAQAPAVPAAAPGGRGEATSEALATMGADAARATFGVDGTGVKACVLSDGVDTLAHRQATGDLPTVDVLPDQTGAGDEGTAMLELVHDIAPGAELGFATANGGLARFAQNIIDLRASGCDVIVDDIIYVAEPAFQDGLVAQAISRVRADGATYFSAAGNLGNLADGTSGTWRGDFDPLDPTESDLGDFHGWGEGVESNTVTAAGRYVTLHWGDPNGRAANDYDLYVLDTEGVAVVASSTYTQDGDDDPFEMVEEVYPGEQVVVVRYTGKPRYLNVRVFGGELDMATDGAGWAHNTSVDAISVAATPAAEAFDPSQPPGPFPERHSSADRSEVFSSDGPIKTFFAPDGRPLTPGDVTATGGVTHNGPDITASDGAATTTPGFIPFYGTSAAAPNAAAVAALALSGRPDLTPDELEAAMVASAIDIEEPGVDLVTGAGITTADALLAHLDLAPAAQVVAGERATGEVEGDGDDVPDPGEIFDVTQTLVNEGPAASPGATATLATTSDDVTIVSGTSHTGALAAGESAAGEPFRIRISRTCACGTRIPFTVSVTDDAAPVPARPSSFTLAVGEPVAPGEPIDVPWTGDAAIPDGDPEGVTATFEVDDVGALGDVAVAFGGSDCSTDPGLDHPYLKDLVITLTSPAGTTARLADRDGGPADDLCGTTFSDAGEVPFAFVDETEAPFPGTYRPATPTALFDGEDADGTWTLRVVDADTDETGSLRDVTLRVTPETGIAAAYAGAPVPIPDADPAGATATIEVDRAASIADLTLTIGGTDCTTGVAATKGLAHPAVSQLVVELTSPAGTTVILADRDGGPGANACQTVFDDGAEVPIALVGQEHAPYTGRVRPATPLAALAGEDAEGTWTVTVRDLVTGGTGTLRDVGLHITPALCDPDADTTVPDAVDDTYQVSFGVPLTDAAPGVLRNDTDAAGDPLTAALVDDVDHGTLALAADGSFTYTPDDGFAGTDTFTYTASDGDLTSEPATVTLRVRRSTDAFVEPLYRDFLDREATDADRAYWGDRLASGSASRGAVARLFARSAEYAGLITRRAYVTYLGRPGEPAGVAYWADRIRRGLSVTELPIFLMGSPEYLARTGGTPGGFVDRIYATILGRAPLTTERASRVAELQRGTSRATVARALHASIESRRIRVRTQYELLLDRAPTVAERDAGVRFLATGDDRLLAIQLAATDEYLQHAAT